MILAHSERPRILIVDDDPATLLVFQMTVEELEMSPLLASDAQEAIQRLGEAEPSLIVVDQQMPGMLGTEFVQWVRLVRKLHCPIVLTSAGWNLDQEAQQVGADAFLQKPFDIDRLIGLMRRALPTTSIRTA
jgi:CheY-like chemotaxis protein